MLLEDFLGKGFVVAEDVFDVSEHAVNGKCKPSDS
jgi:hypothetical protein